MSFKRFDTTEQSFNSARNDANAEFAIFFRTLTGAANSLVVTSNDTVAFVKEKIFELYAIHMDEQTLLYRGKILQDENTLAFYNIGKECIITLVTKQKKKEEPEEPEKPFIPTFSSKRRPKRAPKKEREEEFENVIVINPEKNNFMARFWMLIRYLQSNSSIKLKHMFIDPIISRYIIFRNLISTIYTGCSGIISPIFNFIYPKVQGILHFSNELYYKIVNFCYTNFYLPTKNIIVNSFNKFIQISNYCFNQFSFLYHKFLSGVIKTGQILNSYLIKPIYKGISHSIKKISNFSSWLYNQLKNSIVNPFINGLTSLVNFTNEKISQIYRFVENFVSWICKNLISKPISFIYTNFVKLIKKSISFTFKICKKFFSLLCTLTKNVFSSLCDLGRNLFSFLQSICTFLNDYLLVPFENGIQFLFNSICNCFTYLHTNMTEFLSFLGNKCTFLFEFIQKCTETIINLCIVNPMQFIYKNVKISVQFIYNTCKNYIFNPIYSSSIWLYNTIQKICEEIHFFIHITITNVINNLVHYFVKTIKKITIWIFEKLSKSVRFIFSKISVFCDFVFDKITSFGSWFIEKFKNVFTWIFNRVKSISSYTFDKILIVCNWFDKILQKLGRWCFKVVKNIFTVINNSFHWNVNKISTFIHWIINQTSKIITNIIFYSKKSITWTYDKLSAVCGWFYRNIIKSIGNMIKNSYNWCYSIISSFILMSKRNVISFFSLLNRIIFTKIIQFSKTSLHWIFNKISTCFSWIINQTSKIITNVVFYSKKSIQWTFDKISIVCNWFYRNIIKSISTKCYNYISSFGLFIKRYIVNFFTFVNPYVNQLSHFLYNIIISPIDNTITFIGNSFSQFFAFISRLFKESALGKMIFWVLHGDQRFIQVGPYGMDIRPATMIKRESTNSTVYSLSENSEFSVWIKNSSAENIVCNLKMGGRDIGKFVVLAGASYQIEHNGNFARFSFNNNLFSNSKAISCTFTPFLKHNHTRTNHSSSENQGQNQQVHSTIPNQSSDEQKNEIPEDSNSILNENQESTEKQIESFSLSNVSGHISNQQFKTQTTRQKIDTSRAVVISTELVRK